MRALLAVILISSVPALARADGPPPFFGGCGGGTSSYYDPCEGALECRLEDWNEDGTRTCESCDDYSACSTLEEQHPDWTAVCADCEGYPEIWCEPASADAGGVRSLMPPRRVARASAGISLVLGFATTLVLMRRRRAAAPPGAGDAAVRPESD